MWWEFRHFSVLSFLCVPQSDGIWRLASGCPPQLRVRLMTACVCVRRCRRRRVDPRQALERHSWGGITLHVPSIHSPLRRHFHFPLRVRAGCHAGQALQTPRSYEQKPLGMVFPQGGSQLEPPCFRPYDLTALYPPVPAACPRSVSQRLGVFRSGFSDPAGLRSGGLKFGLRPCGIYYQSRKRY